MASTTSLTVTPAADLMARMRASDHDCAATRRAPPIGTLNTVLGARNGRVNCCSSRAALATDSVEGASETTDPTAPVIVCRADRDPAESLLLRFGLSVHGTRISRSSGSGDIDRNVRRCAEIPSSSAWWILV